METYSLPLQNDGKFVYVIVPFDAREKFDRPKGTLLVLAEIEGHRFRGRLTSLGEGRFAFFLDKAMQKQIGYEGGERQVRASFVLEEQGETPTRPDVPHMAGMDVLQAIETRASIRKFTAEPVEEAQLQMILNAGFCAPSATNKRPWHFVVVKNRDSLEAISKASPYAGMLAQAAFAVVICGDKMRQGMMEFVLEDCAAVAQNMLLCAHGLGLGGIWCGVKLNHTFYTHLVQQLQLPHKIEPVAVLGFGHPAEERIRPPRYEASKVHEEQW